MSRKMDLYKMVILGDGGVGKTALTIQLMLQHFVETYDPTIEDSYRRQAVIDGQGCMIEVLDTAGQEEYTALRDQWIRDGEGFVLVYSISSRSSFSRIHRFHNQIQRVREACASLPSYPGSPLTARFDSGGPVPIMLVGNKSDRVTEREVSTQDGHALARELGVEFVEGSAKNCINVEKAFYDVIRILRRQRMQRQRLQQSTKSQIPASLAEGSFYRTKRTLWGTHRISIPQQEIGTELGRGKLVASLVSSAKSNNEKMLLAYVGAGADVNGHSGADVNGHSGAEGSALHASAAAGHPNIVNILIKKGAAINALGPTGTPPLQLAAAEGHLAVVRLLVHKGATVNQTSNLHGTALSAAASRGRAEVVRFLLKNKADVSIPGGPYGYALLAASWNGNPHVIKHLLDAGADIKARGDGDFTALQMAAFVGKAQAIRVLLDRGAKVDIDAPGERYGCALKAANDRGHFDAVTMLLNAGAKPVDIEKKKGDGKDEKEAEEKDFNGSETKDATPSDLPRCDSIATTLVSPLAKSTSPLTEELGRPLPLPRPISQVSLPQSRTFSEQRRSIQLPILKSRCKINSIGFSTIHDSPNAAVDIVFIHGLQGHPERTWTYTGPSANLRTTLRQRMFRSVSTSVIEDSSSVYWPYDLLAQSEDFADTRILAWGYDTKVVREFFGTTDQQNISQHGNNLMVSLQQERKSNADRPLIFVAHSLGGIVLKVALENSRRSSYQPQYLSIYNATKGIIFLGTPHGGSGTADWGLIVSNITKCAMQGPSQRVLRGLTPNSELLENLRKAFLQMLEDNRFNIHSFFETRPVLSMYGLNSLVVPFESALVGHARREISLGLPGNHSEICKFSGLDDPGYKAVFGALQDYVREATGHTRAVSKTAVSYTAKYSGLPQLELSMGQPLDLGDMSDIYAHTPSTTSEQQTAATSPEMSSSVSIGLAF